MPLSDKAMKGIYSRMLADAISQSGLTLIVNLYPQMIMANLLLHLTADFLKMKIFSTGILNTMKENGRNPEMNSLTSLNTGLTKKLKAKNCTWLLRMCLHQQVSCFTL